MFLFTMTTEYKPLYCLKFNFKITLLFIFFYHQVRKWSLYELKFNVRRESRGRQMGDGSKEHLWTEC